MAAGGPSLPAGKLGPPLVLGGRRSGRSMPRRRLYSAANVECVAAWGWEVKARVRALLSVANRDGISGLARDLLALDVEIFATDGTREHLAGDGIEVGSVSELTSVAPLVGGQVKTFHPAIYAGILARRIICWKHAGEHVKLGERFGLIKFSSRTDLLLPPEVDVLVTEGMRVRGGVSVIGRIK